MNNKFIENLLIFISTAFMSVMVWDSVGVLIFHAQPITIYTAFGFALVYRVMKKFFKSLL